MCLKNVIFFNVNVLWKVVNFTFFTVLRWTETFAALCSIPSEHVGQFPKEEKKSRSQARKSMDTWPPECPQLIRPNVRCFLTGRFLPKL